LSARTAAARRWALPILLLATLGPDPGDTPASAEPRTLRGAVELRGGALGISSEELVVEGRVVGHGVLRGSRLVNRGAIQLAGGSSEVTGPVENRGAIDVVRGSARFAGAVTNRGTIKITDAEVHFAAPYTGLGVYVSDPSDNYFTDLVIGGSGYLVGGVDDRFFVNGDFISTSTNNTSWDTVEAYLEFRTGTDAQHAFHITGAELGPKEVGYSDNFAWGTLHIAAGNDLELFDGNATPGAALYVGEITGASLAGSAVSNISGAAGVNIYYQPDLPANAYLGGLVYDFGVSGQLLPIQPPVPVPAVPGWSAAALGLLLMSLGAAAIRAGRVGAGGALG
jgi:hypothetical protein